MSDTIDTASAQASSESSSAPSSTGSSMAGRDATSDDIAAIWSSLDTDAGSASSPEPPTASAPPAAATTAPPEPPGSTGSHTEGPIPFDRHKEILANTRAKARQEAEQLLAERYRWIDGYQPDEVANGVRLMRWMMSNPDEFEREWQKQREQAQPSRRALEAAIKAEDGTAVYSAEQVQQMVDALRQEIKDQTLREVDAKYASVKQAAEQERLQRLVDKETTALFSEAKQWPMFEELRKDMGRRMTQNPALTLHQAYIQSFTDKGMALMTERARTSRDGLMAEKTAAVTMDTKATPAVPTDYRNMETSDIARAEFERLSGR